MSSFAPSPSRSAITGEAYQPVWPARLRTKTGAWTGLLPPTSRHAGGPAAAGPAAIASSAASTTLLLRNPHISSIVPPRAFVLGDVRHDSREGRFEKVN
jgi:hypothetical protein